MRSAGRIDEAQCRRLDEADPLAFARDRFRLPEGIIYLDGNSLGALPKAVPARLAEIAERHWGEDLIGAWNRHGWIDWPQQIGAKIARLIGAAPHEVIVCDSTSLNLFKCLAAALSLAPARRVVLSDSGNFPTDLYMAQGLVDWLGRGHELRCLAPEAIGDALIGDSARDIAVLLLTEIDYRSGRRHDMADLARRAQAAGILTIWDLAHSAGAGPVDLNGAGADFAVGCGYKYLNGGPGAPAFLFVAERWQNRVRQPLQGWLGHDSPFAFTPDYRPAPDLKRFLVGTPPILSLAALDCGLDTFEGIDLSTLRAKAMALGDLMIDLAAQECGEAGLTLAAPHSGAERGSQVSFRHAEGYAIVQALIARGVIGDFRAPDILRFGFAPLYLRFIDIWRAIGHLRAVLQEEEWRRPEYRRRAKVT